MKFVYKIFSNYDGFRPGVIPDRMQDGQLLRLGWNRYLDEVEAGDEIWVYFHGSHRFENGVYVKGFAHVVLRDELAVLLRVDEYSITTPLTDAAASAQIAGVVSVRYRQVFVLPDALQPQPTCTLAFDAGSCRQRLCENCATWGALPQVDPDLVKLPHRLERQIDDFVSAYWVIPRRSFIYNGGRTPIPGIRRTTEVFERFKLGDEAVAYTLALGLRDALRRADIARVDAIVPVPLSPEKAARDEMHRTLVLAREVSRLTGSPVREWLTLSKPISKRAMRTRGDATAAQFETAYKDALVTDPEARNARSFIVIDDVCTEGSTLRVCAQALWEHDSDVFVAAASAGLMVVRKVVRDEAPLLA